MHRPPRRRLVNLDRPRSQRMPRLAKAAMGHHRSTMMDASHLTHLSNTPRLSLPRLLLERRPWCVLTGAGISTDSGIPDYRDAQGQWKRQPPVSFQDFMGSALARQRYWARSLIGWPVVLAAQPNAAHRSLAALEQLGVVSCVLTQNVDGLHQCSSSQHVIDLHGRLDQIVCMGCGTLSPRAAFQQQLLSSNPNWQHLRACPAPDGDADLNNVDFSQFVVPACPHCGDVLKPDVVFYGENVPRERVQQAMDCVTRSAGLLVVGSSLMVYSGLRFVHVAQRHQPRLPVLAINLGVTRADALLDAKITEPCASALQAWLEHASHAV